MVTKGTGKSSMAKVLECIGFAVKDWESGVLGF